MKRKDHSSYKLIPGVVLSLLLFSGCASSERMTRMSGGVFSKYSAPEDSRIRSVKFHKIKAQSAENRYNKEKLIFHKNLVNIWPFFFRSGQYTSILWPMIDSDPYGFAIRPFFNQEGDEYSILFPLCAWNPVNGDGWLLNTVWDKNSFSFIPLGHYVRTAEKTRAFFTPLYIYTRDKYDPLNQYNFRQNERFLEFLLFYNSTVERRDVPEKYRDLARMYGYNNTKSRIAYLAKRENLPTPANQKELRELQKKLIESSPVVNDQKYGFFPLFHTGETADQIFFNFIGPLFEVEKWKNSDRLHIGFLNTLGMNYEEKPLGNALSYSPAEKTFFSAMLLSKFSKKSYYENNEKVKALRNLSNTYQLNGLKPEAFRERAAWMLQKVDPALQLPPEVQSPDALRCYVEDLAGKYKNLPVYHEYTGGFLPLFMYEFKKNKTFWLSLALLSGYEYKKSNKKGTFFSLPLLTGITKGENRNEMFCLPLLTFYKQKNDSSDFLSIPLLSHVSRSGEKDLTAILFPFGWHSETNYRKRGESSIFPRNKYVSRNADTVELERDFAALGLYYHGRHVFQIVREGCQAEHLNGLRSTIWKLRSEKKSISSRQKDIDRDKKQFAARPKPANKIEYYRNLIREEEIRIEQEKLDQRKLKYNTDFKNFSNQMKQLQLTVSEKDLDSADSVKRILEEMVTKYTELRTFEEYGNGIFFRKEICANGNMSWRVFLGLAGGRKEGSLEEKHILHFFYRYRSQGDKSEELIFPFISVQKDGKDSRISFLWKLWMREVKDGKVNGSILFIPYSY